MTKLSDLQCLLLSHASQRDDGALLPSPASVDPHGAVKAMGALVRKGLAENSGGGDDDDVLPFITPAGMAAIGVEDAGAVASPAPPVGKDVVAAASLIAKGKSARVLHLLRREGGATIADPGRRASARRRQAGDQDPPRCLHHQAADREHHPLGPLRPAPDDHGERPMPRPMRGRFSSWTPAKTPADLVH